MRRKVTAMVLVGGRGTRLQAITKHTAKPAVSFAAKYRLIDFVLSNLTNSAITSIGMVTQYEPHDLMDYIATGSTWDLDVNLGGLKFLTPYTSESGEVWQKGTAHAINQHYRFIEQNNPDYILILSGDHIYKMNYNKLIDYHIKNKADITISTFTVTEHKSRYGMLDLHDSGEVVSFEEKPKTTNSTQASMGVYVFSKAGFKELLNQTEGLVDFGSDVIPLALKQGKRVYGYPFQGYFKDVGTIESLFQTNMELIDDPQLLKLHEYKDFPIYSKSSNLPPHHIIDGVVKKSLISDGVLIYGTIYHSIISSGSFIGEGASLDHVICHHNVTIGKQASLKNCIVVEGTTIPERMSILCDTVCVIDDEYLKQVGDNHE